MDGIWDYPPLETSIQEAVLEETGKYVLKGHNTVAQYILTRPFLDLCKYMVWMKGMLVANKWWEQEGLDLDI